MNWGKSWASVLECLGFDGDESGLGTSWLVINLVASALVQID